MVDAMPHHLAYSREKGKTNINETLKNFIFLMRIPVSIDLELPSEGLIKYS